MTTTGLLRLIWLLAVLCVIFASILPHESGVVRFIDRSRVNDKIQHFSAYAVLGALPMLERFRCRRPAVVLGLLCALGLVLEFAQLFSPGRRCDWHDVAADCLGLIAGVLLLRVLDRFGLVAA